ILLLKEMRKLGDRRGLARAVDADHQYDLRARKGVDLQRFGDRAEHGSNLTGDDLPQLFDIALARVAPLGKAVADTRRHPGPKVGGDQRLLDPVEILVVEPRLAGETSEILAEPLRRPLETAE